MTHKTPFATVGDWGIVKVGSGISVTNGIISTTGLPSINYGFFYDTQNQNNPVANGVNIVQFDTVGSSNQVNVVGNTSITVTNAGTYNALFTVALLKSTTGSRSTASIWMRYNGSDIPWSRQDTDVSNQTSLIIVTGAETIPMAAGSNIQMCWSSADTSVRLAYAPAESNTIIRPAIPSSKITLTRIS
jgi:hypothetical protein